MTTSVATHNGKAPARPAREAASWLGLAASPTFALMAWIAADDAARVPICSSASAVLPMDGMVWMYLLMSLFHLSPWLKLAFHRGATAHPPHKTN